jgi:hypothetical protein
MKTVLLSPSVTDATVTRDGPEPFEFSPNADGRWSEAVKQLSWPPWPKSVLPQ